MKVATRGRYLWVVTFDFDRRTGGVALWALGTHGVVKQGPEKEHAEDAGMLGGS